MEHDFRILPGCHLPRIKKNLSIQITLPTFGDRPTAVTSIPSRSFLVTLGGSYVRVVKRIGSTCSQIRVQLSSWEDGVILMRSVLSASNRAMRGKIRLTNGHYNWTTGLLIALVWFLHEVHAGSKFNLFSCLKENYAFSRGN